MIIFPYSTLVGRIGKLTLQDILDIHMRVLGYVDPSEAGRFRVNQVSQSHFLILIVLLSLFIIIAES